MKKGFTLIEVMCATAVLSVGIMAIYEIFFVSLNTANYASDYLKTAPLRDEQVWQAQDDLSRLDYLTQAGTEGLSYSLADEFDKQKLYKINFSLPGLNKRRQADFSRVAYAIYAEKK